MSELGNVSALNVVSSGLGWSVGRTGDGFEVRIDRASGDGFFGTTIASPATDDRRNAAKELLLDGIGSDAELDAIEAAFASPWVQA